MCRSVGSGETPHRRRQFYACHPIAEAAVGMARPWVIGVMPNIAWTSLHRPRMTARAERERRINLKRRYEKNAPSRLP